MPDDQSHQQELLDELTAYLDGELDAGAVRRVEERLARDADYRTELRKLERTWDLLDRLPRATVDESFTKTTIEMVALSASQEAEAVARQVPRQRRRRRLAGAITMAAALLVGFAIGRQAWPDPNEHLLKDLPVLEDLDLYYQVDDVAFLRLLDEKNLFDEPENDAIAAETTDPAESASAEGTLAARRAKIAALAPGQQQELLRRYERFQALSAAEQQRLRELRSAIDADPSAERLNLVLKRYHEWLKTISASQRATLAEMTPERRIDEIGRIVRHQRHEQRLEALSPADTLEIRRWVEALVDKYRDQLIEDIPERWRKSFERQTDPRAAQSALAPRLFGWSRGEQQKSYVGEDDIEQLARTLSDQARAELAETSTLEEQRRIVGGWVWGTLRRSSAFPSGRRGNQLVSDEMWQFLHQLPPNERERLQKLPPEEMRREILRKMYVDREVGPPGVGPARPPMDGRERSRGGGRSKGPRSGESESDRQGNAAPAATFHARVDVHGRAIPANAGIQVHK